MRDLIILFVTVLIILLALFYIIRQRKKGNKCIGCPYCSCCNKKCGK